MRKLATLLTFLLLSFPAAAESVWIGGPQTYQGHTDQDDWDQSRMSNQSNRYGPGRQETCARWQNMGNQSVCVEWR